MYVMCLRCLSLAPGVLLPWSLPLLGALAPAVALQREVVGDGGDGFGVLDGHKEHHVVLPQTVPLLPDRPYALRITTRASKHDSQ